MLDNTLKTQLQAYLQKLEAPIEIRASANDTSKSSEMLALLDDVASLSEKIAVIRDDSAARKPAFAVTKAGAQMAVNFAGIPLGHEFTSLVLALLQASGYPPKVDANVIEQIRNLPGVNSQNKLEFETFISLSCQNCPDVVQALNLMAIINPNISHTMIDGALFQEEVNARQILSVPSVFLNGEAFGQGRMSLEEIIAKLDTGSAARAAQQLSEKPAFDSLIVGGGPAGAAAAIYSARKGIVTGVVAERFGGQVLDTVGIENFISVQHTEGPKLASSLEQHVKSYGVDIMNVQRAQRLVPAAESASGLIEIELDSGAVLRSKSLIISTGARWREMNVPGEREYRGRGVAYCPHCDGPLFKGKPVAVIGGGNSGVEAAIDLAGIVSHVTLLEFDAILRADAVLQRKLFSLPNVTVITSALSTEVTGDGNKVNGLTYVDRNTHASHRVELAGIFVQIGLLPNTEWLKQGADWLKGTVALSPRGEIEVDARGQTSVPGVFAAGDVTTGPFKQIVIAMGDGAKAALGAFDYLIRSSAAVVEEAASQQALTA